MEWSIHTGYHPPFGPKSNVSQGIGITPGRAGITLAG
jgi:hypothetical protein